MIGRMTRTRTALFAIALASTGVLASCSNDIDGSATPTRVTEQSVSTTRTTPDAWLTTIIPTGDELSKVVGRRVRVDGIPPLLGGVDDLRDTAAGAAITNSSCIAVTSPLEKQAYAAAPVRAVTYMTQSKITTGAVWLSSENDAQALFANLSDEWQECDGASYTSSTGGLRFDYQITEVKSTNDVISAVVRVTSAGGLPVRTERALGIAKDCIVEAEVPVAASPPGALDESHAATDLVETMMSKVKTAPR